MPPPHLMPRPDARDASVGSLPLLAGFELATCEEIHRHITKSEAVQALITLVICLMGSIWYRLDTEDW